MDRAPISANVPADLAERISDVRTISAAQPYFADTEDLQGLVAKELQEPLASLFHSRDQVKAAQRIEGLNHARAIEWLLRDLDELERALKRMWEVA
jgi:hypothetical protein